MKTPLLSLLLLIGLLTPGARAQLVPATNAPTKISLAWDMSLDPSVVGYRIYYGGASRGYTNMVDVGNALGITLTNLVRGNTYYFAATDYDGSGLESDFSAEISYHFNGSLRPPVLRLAISATGNLEILGVADPWTDYSIDGSTDLATWLTLGTATTNRSGSFVFFDSDAAAYDRRFYRARSS